MSQDFQPLFLFSEKTLPGFLDNIKNAEVWGLRRLQHRAEDWGLPGQCRGMGICQDRADNLGYARTMQWTEYMPGQCIGLWICQDRAVDLGYARTLQRTEGMPGQCRGLRICQDSVKDWGYARTVQRTEYTVCQDSADNCGYVMPRTITNMCLHA